LLSKVAVVSTVPVSLRHSTAAATWAGVREYQFWLAVTDCPVV